LGDLSIPSMLFEFKTFVENSLNSMEERSICSFF